MGFKDYIRIFKRHRWWIVGWFCLITIGYLFYDSLIKKVVYISTADLEIQDPFYVEEKKDGAPKVNDEMMQMAGLTPQKMEDRKKVMLGEKVMQDAFNRYLEIANSDENKQFQDKDNFSLIQVPNPVFKNDSALFKENVLEFRKCLSIEMDGSEKTFKVRSFSTNPYKAKWIIEAFKDAYGKEAVDRAQETIKRVNQTNAENLRARQELIKQINEEKIMVLDKLKKMYGDHLIWEKGPDQKIEDRDEIMKKIDLTNKEIYNIESEMKDYENFDPERWLVEDSENNKIVELQSDLYSKREKLREELANLRVTFTDSHPKIIEKLAELNSLNASFPRLAQEIIEKKMRELKRAVGNKVAYRQKLEEDFQRLSKEISIIQEHHQSFKDFESKLAKYTEDVSRIERQMEKLQEDLEKTSSLLKVNTAPSNGVEEVNSKNTIYYIMIFGIIIGLAFAYILEYLDDTIRTPHDVEKFIGLRVIGTVPLLSKGEEKLLHRIALKSPISEMMNTLSMIIQSWMLKMKGQVLLIVSSKPGEGKSTFITNLSVALCRGGEKVVLIDSDLRKPSLHRFFGVDNSVGFSNYLEDSFADGVEDTDEAKIAKIVHHTDVEGLFMIPSGPIPSNPVGLLKGDNVERLLNHLKTYIGVILIDTPPLAMIDAGVLATKVNAVVTVMDAGKVTKKEALAGKHLIENVGGNNIGVILNKVTLEGEEYYYYFEGYSYYYGSSRNRKKKPV